MRDVFIKIDGGTIAEYPVTLTQLRARGLVSGDKITGEGFYQVHPTSAPETNSQQYAHEIAPVFNEALEVWFQAYEVRDKPAHIIEKELGKKRAAARNLVNAQFSEFMQGLVVGIPIEERETWWVQKEAADSFKAGRATQVQRTMLENIAIPGETLDIISDKILAKSAQMQVVSGYAINLKRATEKAVDRSNSIEEIDAELAVAVVSMTTKIKELGLG